MTRARSQLSFHAVRTEGGLLPSDILQRIAALDPKLPGTRPEDYHLLSGERFGEAVSRSWSRLVSAWRSFQDALTKLPGDDTATTVTRERWLLPLFQELGYGRLSRVTAALEVEGKSYPVSHLWQRTPIHLLGCRVSLEQRERGVAGAARSSPHSLMQELLNRSDDYLWGFLSNGLTLRLLRDHHSLTQQAYVEFDLEAIMEGEQYSEFFLLWLICHQSRVEAENPKECWLSSWLQTARDEGVSALEKLRQNVEAAITALGTGFLKHRANATLLAHLEDGTLDKQDYYRQLLRLVYRLIFLFVAEDREALLDPRASDAARDRYQRFYATRRLRQLCERRRGGPHADLWQGLRLVMNKLWNGSPELGLPALGSFLWSPQALPDLGAAECANEDLLLALYQLCFIRDGKQRFPVNWRNVGADELGSIYESLLELHPDLHKEAGTFSLKTAAGHERKTTGSYYTPTPLVDCLLDSALDPVLDAATKKPTKEDAERAILDLKVCDPACGSGHFLVAAARRIAKRLASVRSGDEEPSPKELQRALRDVVGHCIYGVDLNPMAVELCKVSLWMEAIEPGKPLSFLDSHIQQGNALLGTTPALLEKGITEEAFEPIEGDDKDVARRLKKRNREGLKGQTHLDPLFAAAASSPKGDYRHLANEAQAVEQDDDNDIGAVHKKEEHWDRLTRSPEFRDAWFLADAWCAAFVWPKQPGELETSAPVEDLWQRMKRDVSATPPATRREVRKIARDYSFFHWHLAFPQVFLTEQEGIQKHDTTGWMGGFDVVLGNPPWDTLSPDVREYFGQHRDGMRALSPTQQQAAITELLSNSVIAAEWKEHSRRLYTLVQFLKQSGRFVLFAPGNLGKGDFNVFRMFIEHALYASKIGGYVALIVPGTFYGGANVSSIRKYVFDRCELKRIFVSNSRRGWFAGVDVSRFCIFAAKHGGRTSTFLANFGMQSPADLTAPPVEIDGDFIREQSPDTYTIPDVRSSAEVELAEKLLSRFPCFGDQSASPPHRHYQSEIHMGGDRDLFSTAMEGLPLYEGRMIWQFDHRAKSYASGHGHSSTWEEYAYSDPRKSIGPQWRIPSGSVPAKVGNRTERYRLAFRDVAQPRDERSLIATIIPPGTICGDKVPTLDFGLGNEWAYLPWLAVANSFVMDWLARAKLSSPKLSFTLMDSLPFPRPKLADPWVQQVAPLVLRLVCTAPEMADFWNAMAVHGFCQPIPPDTVSAEALMDEAQRSAARAEIDAVVAFQVFGLSRQTLDALLDTFPLLRRKEDTEYKEFRSKRLVLERYDAMAEAAAKGASYSASIAPPSYDPVVAAAPRSESPS